MNIDVRIVDVNAALKADPSEHPTAMLKREVAEGHLVTPHLIPADRTPYKILQGPLDEKHEWSIDKGGSHVAVPLHPYIVEDGANYLVKFGLQFGALAAADVKATFGSSVASASRLVILMSSIFGNPNGKLGYCVYVGLAIKQE